jgi:hypothetical protein
MLGRNDPCHCGSGKKYKKCHLAGDQGKARTIRSLSTPGQWVDFHWEQIDAQIEPLVESQLGLIGQRWSDAICTPNFKPFMNHHALLDVGQHGQAITDIVKQTTQDDPEKISNFAQALSKTHLSCYQVRRCRKGQYVELEDQFNGALILIHDAQLSEAIEPLEALCGRVVYFNDVWALLPGWSKLEFRARKKVFAQVRAHYDSIGADLTDEEEMKALLKRSPETVLDAIANNDAYSEVSA